MELINNKGDIYAIQRINLSDFKCLTKYDRLQRFSKSFANSFMRLPKFMFLGELDIGRARELANIVDNISFSNEFSTLKVFRIMKFTYQQ